MCNPAVFVFNQWLFAPSSGMSAPLRAMIWSWPQGLGSRWRRCTADANTSRLKSRKKLDKLSIEFFIKGEPIPTNVWKRTLGFSFSPIRRLSYFAQKRGPSRRSLWHRPKSLKQMAFKAHKSADAVVVYWHFQLLCSLANAARPRSVWNDSMIGMLHRTRTSFEQTV